MRAECILAKIRNYSIHVFEPYNFYKVNPGLIKLQSLLVNNLQNAFANGS